MVFEKLTWKSDRLLIDELVFRLETCKNDRWDLGGQCFLFYKDKKLVDQYERLLTERSGFHAENILELGIWDGGSIAFWHEILKPSKHVAIDRLTRGNSPYFDEYVRSRALGDRIQACWGVDQADAKALRRIVAGEFTSALDLVIDDASHLYLPTKASFETLFPLLRPGGLYVIEDWQWAYLADLDDNPYFADQPLMTQFVVEILEAVGSSSHFFEDRGVIRNVHVYPGLLAIERGDIPEAKVQPFSLDRLTYRRTSRRGSWIGRLLGLTR